MKAVCCSGYICTDVKTTAVCRPGRITQWNKTLLGISSSSYLKNGLAYGKTARQQPTLALGITSHVSFASGLGFLQPVRGVEQELPAKTHAASSTAYPVICILPSVARPVLLTWQKAELCACSQAGLKKNRWLDLVQNLQKSLLKWFLE